MESIFESKSSTLGSFHRRAERKLTPSLYSGDDDFMGWMSAFDSVLLSKYPTLSKESQNKLKALLALNRQMDTAAEEVILNINRCEEEFEALHLKIWDHLEQLGVSDDDFFPFETLELLQESTKISLENQCGDGTDLGSTVTLAKNFLIASNLSRKRLGLLQDIHVIQKKNNKLRENLKFFDKESKLASEEVAKLHSELKENSIDLDLSKKKADKLDKTRTELSEFSELPANSDLSILNSHCKLKSLLHEIFQLEEKLKQYNKLPPNMPEAVKIVKNTKEHLDLVTEELKRKLKSFSAR